MLGNVLLPHGYWLERRWFRELVCKFDYFAHPTLAALEKTGQPIGVNDIHIAAHARSEGLVLVTNNLRELERVPALQLENWVEKV